MGFSTIKNGTGNLEGGYYDDRIVDLEAISLTTMIIVGCLIFAL